METIDGDGSETALGTKKKGENRRPVSVPASPRTTGIKRRATTTIYIYIYIYIDTYIHILACSKYCLHICQMCGSIVIKVILYG